MPARAPRPPKEAPQNLATLINALLKLYYFCQVGNGSYPNCNKTCGTSTNTQFSTKSSFSRRHQSQTRIKTRS